MPLIKPPQFHRVEALSLIVPPGLDPVVVNSDTFVGVSYGQVCRHCVEQSVVIVSELGEGGVGDVEFNVVWAEEEVEDECEDAEEDDDGEDDLED